MGKEDGRESFLTNLGRATRRGVRQCKKCGTLNGTRGYSCKNKSCDVVFKEKGWKRKLSTEACKIVNGTDTQIYSVRVRDKGPDYRGFVVLENLNIINNNNNSTHSISNNNNNSTHSLSSPFDSPDQLSNTPFSSSNILQDLDGGGSGGGGGGLHYVATTHHFESLDTTPEFISSDINSLLSSSQQQQGSSAAGCSSNNTGAGNSNISSISVTINNTSGSGDGVINSTNATTGQAPNLHCYVESCHKLSKHMQAQKGSCSHIKAASQCFKNSEPLTLKSSVLNSMPLHPDLKTEIWQLATATPGPLVQRVSKNIMVVKCQSDALHPLGFLHFSFQSSRGCRDNATDCGKYFCSCRSFKTSGIMLRLVPLRSCIHLYACLLALASHSHLAEEFAQYIALVTGEQPTKPLAPKRITMEQESVKIEVTEEEDGDNTTAYIRVSEAGTCGGSDDIGRERSFLILNDSSDPGCQVEVEVVQEDDAMLQEEEDCLLRDASDPILHEDAAGNLLHALQVQHRRDAATASALIAQSDIESKLEIQLHTTDDAAVELCTADGGSIAVYQCGATAVQQCATVTVMTAADGATCDMLGAASVASVVSKDDDPAVVQASSALLTLHNTNTNEKKRHHFSKVIRKPREPVAESSTSLSFCGWLAGATERINHTMQYTMTGKPAPLVFHVPSNFFACLLERIQQNSRKKIPTIETSVPNVDSSIPGKQTRYTWNIFNLSHVKTIFHTPYVTLQTTRSFLINRNGTYQSYQPLTDPQTLSASRTPSQPLIRPQEYRTVLRVGPSAYHPAAKPTPFVVEWTPHVFTLAKMGELRVKFEYEHIHNGQLVKNIAFREVLTPTAAAAMVSTTTMLPNPIIINNSTPSVSSVKSTPIKQSPTAIASKVTVLSQMKDNSLDDMGTAILDISLPHETFVDCDGYTTLLF